MWTWICFGTKSDHIEAADHAGHDQSSTAADIGGEAPNSPEWASGIDATQHGTFKGMRKVKKHGTDMKEIEEQAAQDPDWSTLWPITRLDVAKMANEVTGIWALLEECILTSTNIRNI